MAILSQWTHGRQVFLQVQGPIVVSDTSEPEPDCCLVRGTPDDYVDRIPHAADVLAVFEVAYSSLLSDRRTKQRLYASAEIPIYVIVNLQDDVIEVLSDPSPDEEKYRLRIEYRTSETVTVTLGEHGSLSFPSDSLF